MGSVLKAARLEICPSCGKHGWIVFSDGTKSTDFSTVEEALSEIGRATLHKLLICEEARVLEAEVRKSSLMTEEEFVQSAIAFDASLN